MNKKHFIIIFLFIIGTISFIFMEGFVNPKVKADKLKYAEKQKDPLTHDFSAVLKYKSKYMGDVSNLSNLNNNLPLYEVKKTYELFPDVFMVNINFKEELKNISNDKLKEIIAYNSSAEFTLIDNLQILNFNFLGTSYSIKREAIEKWYGGVNLTTFQDKDKWKKEVQDKLSDKSYVNDFMNKNVEIKAQA